MKEFGKYGGIVSNNPSNPEAASMSVMDTRLVNMPEKTRFDVSSEIQDPKPEDIGGSFANTLGNAHIEIMAAPISSLLAPDGTWDRSREPEFKYEYTDPDTSQSTIYQTLDEVPNLLPSQRVGLRLGVDLFYEEWVRRLDELEPQTGGESIFQLDPNQLLTVSSGFKVVLRRPF